MQRMICLEILLDFFVVVLDVSDEQSTRRSKRTIVPPLQYWKNERIDYERRKSGRVDGNDFYPSLPSTLFFLSSFLTVSSLFYFNFASGSSDSLVPTISQVSKFVTITALPPHYSHSSFTTLQLIALISLISKDSTTRMPSLEHWGPVVLIRNGSCISDRNCPQLLYLGVYLLHESRNLILSYRF